MKSYPVYHDTADSPTETFTLVLLFNILGAVDRIINSKVRVRFEVVILQDIKWAAIGGAHVIGKWVSTAAQRVRDTDDAHG